MGCGGGSGVMERGVTGGAGTTGFGLGFGLGFDQVLVSVWASAERLWVTVEPLFQWAFKR
jgi:hypothetical protein